MFSKKKEEVKAPAAEDKKEEVKKEADPKVKKDAKPEEPEQLDVCFDSKKLKMA